MRILYLSQDVYGSLTWSFERAFRKLGCTVDLVDCVGTPEMERIPGGPFSRRVAFRVLRPWVRWSIRRRLTREIRGQYDMVFFHKTNEVPPGFLKEVRERTGGKLYCFYPDHPYHVNGVNANSFTVGVVAATDCYFIWGRFIAPALSRAGARRVEHLPFGWDPDLHYPPALSPTERERYRSQVAFVGSHSEERAAWFSCLLDHDVGLWGPGWGRATRRDARFAKAVRGPARVGREFAKVYAAADIGVNLIQVYGNGHNMRTFEAPACGGFVMSNRTEELVRMFREGEEIVCFSTPEELREKVAYYLERPAERARIARNSWERIQGDTYLERARRILAVFEEHRT